MPTPTGRPDTALSNAPLRRPWSFKCKLAVGFSAIALVLFVLVAREVVLLLTAKINPSIDYPGQRNALVLTAAEQRAGGAVVDGTAQWAQFESILLTLSHENQAFVKQFYLDRGEQPPKGLGISFDLAINPPYPNASQLDIDLAKAGFQRHIKADTQGKLRQLQQLMGATRTATPKQPLMNFDGPTLGPTRGAARLLVVMFTDAIRKKDVAGGVDAARTINALGATASGQGTHIDALIGIATQAILHDAVATEVAAGMSPELTSAILAEFLRSPQVVGIDFVLENQRIEMFDSIQWTHSESGRFMPSATARLIPGGAPFIPGSNAFSFMYATREQSEQVVDNVFEDTARQTKLPLSKTSFEDFDASMDALGMPYDLVRANMPALPKLAASFAAFTTTRSGTILLLALEAHAAEHGAFPASLEALVPQFLPELPTDAVSPDGKFRYTLRTPTPDDSRAYLLYSVGIDGIDNARAAKEPAFHQVLTSKKDGSGQDYVFNRPREPVAQPQTK